MNSKRNWRRLSPRGMVLAILGVVTLGVAVLSMAVSYQILEPRFGVWAVPTVGALDALWVVFQATEILSGNNRVRAKRVQWAGLALTAVNAAIPTVDLALRLKTTGAGFDLAVVIAPIAIGATKGAWWFALPALGRRVSDATRRAIATRRQQVADQLEKMEADTADRIELLNVARDLNERVSEAETAYRLSVLKTQQSMTEDLHEQAGTTAATVAEKVLPASVAAIALPELGTFTPGAPALPGTATGTPLPGRGTTGTQVSALPHASGTETGTPGVTPTGTPAHKAARTGALADLAAVAGVPVPVPGEQLTDAQIGVVLRHLRYCDDPPLSYRQARDGFRSAGYQGSEERIRRAWTALRANEGHGEMAEDIDSDDEASEDSDV
ncbi:hypothetical protein OHB41_51390 [Streptomyces sp. NBC_01571]|uniref:hypothetical protein n=1 Tax=Streptomyces sp. NBC_01571 TaxID=2975883 RepID=UPI00224E4E72|nr:hypothetical protein [Streptomyces sp. NBC_01571]MCX4581364.1 hypothetical protein [Streptomyces sp. NBC_01571]